MALYLYYRKKTHQFLLFKEQYIATIAHHHVISCLHGIRQRKLDSSVLLARAGINPAKIWLTPHRIQGDQVARLYRSVQQELDDEFMGFTNQPVKYGIFELFCEISIHCKTLGDLLEKMINFYSLITNTMEIDLSIDQKNIAKLGFYFAHPALDPDDFLAQYLLVIWHRFPSWYIEERIRLKGVSFSHKVPSYIDELKIMFPGTLSFGELSNSISFDAKYLKKPLVRTHQEVKKFLAHHPANIMAVPGDETTLESKIEREIMDEEPSKLYFPKISILANKLNMSSLMLYRKLKDEGTSYQKIKDDMRRELAINKLVTEKLSVEEVSELVGFAEPRSFTRAFKQWTGLTPRSYCKYQSLK